jgi:hypothetical protein
MSGLIETTLDPRDQFTTASTLSLFGKGAEVRVDRHLTGVLDDTILLAITPFDKGSA